MYWNLKRVLAIITIAVFVGSIFYYAYYQSRGIIAGPTITLLSPKEGEILAEQIVLVKGVAERAKELTLDGRPIFIDLSGNFTEQLLLFPGYNIIELAAKDADGREEKKTVAIVWNGTSSPVLPSLSNHDTQNATSAEAVIQ